LPGEPFTPETTLAILLGASRWPLHSKIDNKDAEKAFFESAKGVVEYLTNPKLFKLPPDNLLNLFDDDRSPNDINRRITTFLQTSQERASAAQRPIRDLLVYYIGHGGFTSGEQAYFLALRCTETESEGVSSLRMSDLAATIKKRARDLRRYIVLDCCFAESAYDVLQDAGGSLASAAHTKSLQEFPGKGTALLCSSSARDFSRAPKEEKYTMFSGALLDVLRMGDVRLDKALSLEEVGRRVTEVINTKFPDKEVRPKVSSPDEREGDIADVPIFPNAALLERSADERVSNVEEKLMQILEKLKMLDDLSARIPSLQQKIASLEAGRKLPGNGIQKDGETVADARDQKEAEAVADLRARVLKTAPPSVQVEIQAYRNARIVGIVWALFAVAICGCSVVMLMTTLHKYPSSLFALDVLQTPLHWVVLLLAAFSLVALFISVRKRKPISAAKSSEPEGEWESLPIVLKMRSTRLVQIFGEVYVATPLFEIGVIVYTLTAIYLLATFIPAQITKEPFQAPISAYGTPGSSPAPTFSGTPGVLPSPTFSGTPVSRSSPGFISPTPSLDLERLTNLYFSKLGASETARVVFESVTGYSRADIDSWVQKLKALGFEIRDPPPLPSPETSKETEVKYYFEEDKTGAQLLVEILQTLGVHDVHLKQFTPPPGYHRGHFDVDLGSAKP